MGLAYFERTGLARSDLPTPIGLVDRLEELVHPDLDPGVIPDAVADFLLRTAALDLLVRPHWRRGFRWAARALHHLGAALGQMCMPVAEARITTTLGSLGLHPAHLPGERSCLRRYADGAVMQVVRYATFRRGEAGFLRVTFPLSVGVLEGTLRLDEVGRDERGQASVRLTSEGRTGHDDPTGIRLRLGRWSLPLPLGETMTFWATDSSLAPVDLVPELLPGTTLLARHEQRLGPLPFVRHSYYFRPTNAHPVQGPPAGTR